MCLASIIDHNHSRDLAVWLCDPDTRPGADQRLGSPFSVTRFTAGWQTAPNHNRVRNWTLFIDPDVFFLCDAAEVFKFTNAKHAAVVVKHPPYQSAQLQKYVGSCLVDQTNYPRKNWSSVMLLNGSYRNRWNPKTIHDQAPLSLHGFHGFKDSEIGSLPAEYNYLVAEQTRTDLPKIAHFTLGTPRPSMVHKDPIDQELANLWYDTYARYGFGRFDF